MNVSNSVLEISHYKLISSDPLKIISNSTGHKTEILAEFHVDSQLLCEQYDVIYGGVRFFYELTSTRGEHKITEVN